MKKFEKDSWEIKEHPEWFYCDRAGHVYPYLKEDISRKINPFIPSTFIPILKEMDYPFIENEWLATLYRSLRRSSISSCNIFGRYLAKMKLKGFKNYNFEDSAYLNEMSHYNNKVPIEKCKYEIRFEREKIESYEEGAK